MVSQRELQAEVTRDKILDAAAGEIYQAGYQAASIGNILKKLGISKGALYHHFPSKQALGYAVLDEVFGAGSMATWDAALAQDDPLGGLHEMFLGMEEKLKGERLCCGCPINNLAQEMSSVDEGFRCRIEKIYERWHRRIHDALAGAQRRGQMRGDVDPSDVAYFIIASLQGATGLAKNAQNCAIYKASIHGLLHYLDDLRKVAA